MKHIAAHVEDHPIDYADFQGTIPDGQYGAGTVETWDRGTWEPVNDPDHGMQKGELTFILHGTAPERPLPPGAPEAQARLAAARPTTGCCSKATTTYERAGAEAEPIEQATPAPEAGKGRHRQTGEIRQGEARPRRRQGPARPRRETRQTAADPVAADSAPSPTSRPPAKDWVSEIKFDGYRLLAWIDHGKVRLVTRNGHDWTDRLPAVAKAVAALNVETALVDGELVALDKDGISSFPALQAALSAGKDATLYFHLFDLLHLDGWDLRDCALLERKRVLQGLDDWRGMLRYSDHHTGDPAAMRREACRMKLEGIVCKQADAPYRAGRRPWLAEGEMPGPRGVYRARLDPAARQPHRPGRAASRLLRPEARLHYAGGVGTGFSDDELASAARQARRADRRPAARPAGGGRSAGQDDPLGAARAGGGNPVSCRGRAAGRVRHAVYLGLREDKSAGEVVRDVANPEAEHKPVNPRQPPGPKGGPIVACRRRRRATVHDAAGCADAAAAPMRGSARATQTVHAAQSLIRAAFRRKARRSPCRRSRARDTPPPPGPAPPSSLPASRRPRAASIEGVTVTHPDRELWPGITKQHLAEYWQAVADHALPGLAHRPAGHRALPGRHRRASISSRSTAMARCPTAIRSGEAAGAPYLAIDDMHGLVAMAQISAIELHAWGATEADPLHPDFMVFDLDPGRGRGLRRSRPRRNRRARPAAAARAAIVLPHHRRQGACTSSCR